MIKQVLLVVLALACAVNTIHLHQVHEAGANLPPGTVNLIANNGLYLRDCYACGGHMPDPATLQAVNDTKAVWTLEKVGSKVAFKGYNKLYLTACNNCYERSQMKTDKVFVVSTEKENCLFTPVLQPNGKYAFQGQNGNYLALCNKCGPRYAKNVFVFESNPANPWAQWDVQYTNLPKAGFVFLQADNGYLLKLCIGCGAPNAVSVEPGIGYSYKWKLSRVGTKVVLQAYNGNWLSRCNNCWTGALYPDSAFAHLNSNDAPYSQWTAIKQNNEKWAFQGDNGKFLARCYNCVPGNVPNLAFVHSLSASEPWSQWTLSYA